MASKRIDRLVKNNHIVYDDNKQLKIKDMKIYFCLCLFSVGTHILMSFHILLRGTILV